MQNLQGGVYLNLQDESEFRDKLTKIAIYMKYSLDLTTAMDKNGLKPILDQFTPDNITKQVGNQRIFHLSNKYVLG